MNKIKDLTDIFINCRLSGLSSKYLNNDHLRLDELKPLFKVSELGYSVNQETIYCINIGKGRTKVLLWSQMHGNESTSTKSLLDLMNAFNNNEFLDVLENCTLFIIPILNPDGAREYTRVNYNKIDLNRDAKNNSQPESKLLALWHLPPLSHIPRIEWTLWRVHSFLKNVPTICHRNRIIPLVNDIFEGGNLCEITL